MARFIGIDWDHDSLYLITGTIGRRQAQVERAVIWQEPHTLDPAAAEAAGKRLRDRLKEANIAPAPVLVCLGRERVIFKELRYPPVDAKQEPALIQFQTGKELTEPISRVVIDYTHSRFGGNGTERVALVSVVRRQWLQSLQALCKGAGLTLACVTPRAYGIARGLRQKPSALAAPAPAEGATVAVLTICKRWAEFTIVKDGEVRLARPLAVNENLLEDVRRNLALYANQSSAGSGRDAVQALYFSGGNEHAALNEQLRESLAIPVHRLDPFAEEVQVQAADDRGGFAGLVGLARLWAEQKAPINFASPKEPKPETEGKRRFGLLVAALAAVVLLGAVVVRGDYFAKQEQELLKRRQKLVEQDKQIEKMKPDQQKLASLIQWDNTALSWVDEIYELTKVFPQVEGFHVTLLEIKPLNIPTVKQGTNIQLGMSMRIKGEVPVAHAELVDQLITNLNQYPYFQPKTKITKVKSEQGEGAATIEVFEFIVEIGKKSAVEDAAKGHHGNGAKK